ncbi:MAG: hypothetical protein HN742_39225 [Lentisphaerae bacterium]|jgi:hypothetical protein|nr:hypothetical protein [Lentisphaerota bacterium]MBT4822347.1 hypothetical protein [Lentisphaerota bacterium]MBT5609986.1 hypothetical protein [Lentisphaerota bacterium]MBT7060645.1 hypothetical protein [Lentisphaerota bacterium]MBT7847965.1 hypothetical protein [Lentisphaerota bacterium]
MLKKRMFEVMGLLLVAPCHVFAWGMGHNSQTDQVWRGLPESFRVHFTERQRQDFVKHYSHYTDFYTPRHPKPRTEPAAACCAEAVKRLKFNPHKTYYVFPLFVAALREERYEDALMWAGCISHSVGDMGALNHPDILWFSHVCLGASGVMGPGGRSVPAVFAPDTAYGKSYFDPKLQPVYAQAMAGYQGEIISRDPEEVLEHIIVRDYLRKVEMNEDPGVYRIFLLMETYNQDRSPATYRKIAEAQAAYTRRANREILDTIVTGIAFAEMTENVTFDVSQAAIHAGKQIRLARENGPKAEEMIAFTGVWRENAPKGAVGVIISDRPSLVFSGGCPFGSKHQWLSSIVLKGLKREGISYQCLSYERLEELDVQQNPVVLTVAPKCTAGLRPSFMASLVQYINSGGRLIWLGGDVPGKIAELLPSGRLPDISTGDRFRFPFPVTDPDRHVEAEFVSLADGRRFPVPDLRLKSFSWNTFGECRCLLFDEVDGSPGTTPLMRLETPRSSRVVGAHCKTGKGDLVYLPWFTICPYMLSDERVMASLVGLELDFVGKGILLPWCSTTSGIGGPEGGG